MEAATPLRPPQVRTVGDRLLVDGLVVDDETAVRLAREREDAGEEAARLVVDAIEIGARVLDREQAGANAEFVRTEFERASGDVQRAFGEQAHAVAEALQGKLEEVFGPDSGHLTRALERHFSDDSAGAVQNRVRELVAEVMARSREDLLRQFSADEGHNPLADFKRGTMAIVKQASDQQVTALRSMRETIVALEKEVQGLRDEKQKVAELDEERERGTAKGRSFEESVAEALDELARLQGDEAEAVGDLKGGTGKKGDVVVAIDACRGPARGRIVFEAKNKRLSRPDAFRELDGALAEREAQFAVLVVPADEKVPAKMAPLREYNGDKLIATYDPEEGSRLSLEVAYSLARARVLMTRGEAAGIDAGAVRETVERALLAMEDVRKVKQQLTGATTSIGNAEKVVDAMAARVRELLARIETLTSAGAPDAPGDGTLFE